MAALKSEPSRPIVVDSAAAVPPMKPCVTIRRGTAGARSTRLAAPPAQASQSIRALRQVSSVDHRAGIDPGMRDTGLGKVRTDDRRAPDLALRHDLVVVAIDVARGSAFQQTVQVVEPLSDVGLRSWIGRDLREHVFVPLPQGGVLRTEVLPIAVVPHHGFQRIRVLPIALTTMTRSSAGNWRTMCARLRTPSASQTLAPPNLKTFMEASDLPTDGSRSSTVRNSRCKLRSTSVPIRIADALKKRQRPTS